MIRVEFKLTMPSRGSWNNRWSGEHHNYTLVRDLDVAKAEPLEGRSWSYCWSDGWRAEISARILHEGTSPEPSHGFHGYDWMVASILRYGTIYADHEQPEATP